MPSTKPLETSVGVGLFRINKAYLQESMLLVKFQSIGPGPSKEAISVEHIKLNRLQQMFVNFYQSESKGEIHQRMCDLAELASVPSLSFSKRPLIRDEERFLDFLCQGKVCHDIISSALSAQCSLFRST